MEELWNRILSWIEANTPPGQYAYNPPASEVEIGEAEAIMGITFPEDVRDFYRLCNGLAKELHGMVPSDMLSLEAVVQNWKGWKEVSDAGTFQNIKSTPSSGVRDEWWNPKWIPLTHNGGGSHNCLDLDPAEGGTYGQIIDLWNDSDERCLNALSFRDWLEEFAEGLDTGDYVYADEYEGIVPLKDVTEED